MKSFPAPDDANLLIGPGTSDDAGIYKISSDLALVQTVDFITPVVDDPFQYGQVAAANSLSDIYAMGGTPLTVMNVVGFPTDKFTFDILSQILAGGMSKITESGATLVGGHSVEDPEMKYGLSVTGTVNPGSFLANNTIQEGDLLILTKPLGTGIISTAVKAGLFDEALMPLFIGSMTTLNRVASEVMKNYRVSACTDVTGFGLAGHAFEMTGKGVLQITLFSDGFPILPGVKENADMGLIPAGMYHNRSYLEDLFRADDSVDRFHQDIAFDPQTSGGLLFSIHRDDADACMKELHKKGISQAAIVGEVSQKKDDKRILLV